MKYCGKTRFDPSLDKLYISKFGFKQFREGNIYKYLGTIQPTLNSFNYEVEIKSYPVFDPDIFITNKELSFLCKHLYYPSRNLCLFNLNEYKWHQNRSIGNDIIPIIASWLFFYELWELTGIWYYEQYPHDMNKSDTIKK